MVLEVAYIGSHTMHEPINTNINFIPRADLSTSLVRDTPTINLLTGTVTNPFKGLIPACLRSMGPPSPLISWRCLYPEFPLNGITEQNNPAGSGYYREPERPAAEALRARSDPDQ